MQTKKEDIRTKILTVSERLFIRNGYENTSLKMIADRCYISKSNIYRYFRSKEEIYDTLVGPTRKIVQEGISYFAGGDFAGKYTEDKVEEVSVFLSKLMVGHQSGLLVMLSSSEGQDARMLKTMLNEQFLMSCPINDDEFKMMVSNILIFGLTDILLKHDDEDELKERLKLLFSYHYRGLNGVKNELNV